MVDFIVPACGKKQYLNKIWGGSFKAVWFQSHEGEIVDLQYEGHGLACKKVDWMRYWHIKKP